MVGLIEGLGEGTIAVVKIFSGTISDWLGKRKLLALIGYGLSALSKPFFALAVSPIDVLCARLADRVGKGIREAPRDALIADVTPAAIRGAAFGVRQSLDTVGAIIGPLLAMGMLVLLSGNLRVIFWLALIPGALSVITLLFGVRESTANAPAKPLNRPLPWRKLRGAPRAYWAVTVFGVVFTFARFSEAFLILRGQDMGIPLTLVPLILIAMNVIYAATAFPAGKLSDRIDRRLVLVVGLSALIAADFVLAWWDGLAGVLIGATLWGLHMGFSQGLLSALIADTAPPDLRGTAFGLFSFISGIALFGASLLAGVLWETIGHASMFLASASLCGIALIGLLVLLQIQRNLDPNRSYRA